MNTYNPMNTLLQFQTHVRNMTGTTATTARGLLKAWRNHPRTRLRPLEQRGATKGSSPWLNARSKEKASIAERAKYPEFKRAARDTSFRKAWVARLRREARPLTQPIDSALKMVAWHTSKHKVRAINQTLARLGTKPIPEPVSPPVKLMSINLSITYEKAIREKIGGIALDKAAWSYEPGLVDKVIAHIWSDSTKKNGRWVTLATADHRISYQSFGVVLGGGNIWETLVNGRVERTVLDPDVVLSIRDNVLYASIATVDRKVAAPVHLPPEQWKAYLFNALAYLTLS